MALLLSHPLGCIIAAIDLSLPRGGVKWLVGPYWPMCAAVGDLLIRGVLVLFAAMMLFSAAGALVWLIGLQSLVAGMRCARRFGRDV